MLVPERLALIGGGILLSSLLIFSVKDQMTHLMPNVVQGISGIYGNKGNEFYVDYRQAQQNGNDTGTWGTSKWYIDKNEALHVGAGQLQGHLHEAIGGDNASNIQSIDFDEGVQAPQDSSFLLSTSDRGIMGVTHLHSIQGLDQMDTSQVQSMNNIFSNDANLTDLDLSSWNVNQVKDLSFAFWGNTSLSRLDLANWNTTNTDNMQDTFDVTRSLSHLTLGNDTYIHDGDHSGFSNSKDANASYHNGSQFLSSYQLEDGDAHPGTWTSP